MSRKDYRLIADALAALRRALPPDPAARAAWNDHVVDMCRILQADNPRFSRMRFVEACEANPDLTLSQMNGSRRV